MICPKCNASVPDDSEFCPNCGVSLEAAVRADGIPPQSPPPGGETQMTCPAPAGQKDFRAALSKVSFNACITDYIGAFIGVICILIGIVFFATTSSSVHSTSFGADFYTYTYQGIVAVVAMGVKLVKLLALMLILFGALVDCHYIRKILDHQKKEM